MTRASKKQKNWLRRRDLEQTFAPNGALNRWRQVIFNGALIDSYSHKGFIDSIFTQPIAQALQPYGRCVIGDFGSGTGHVAKTVVEQLERLKNDDVLPFGIDRYNEDFWKEKPSPVIQTAQGSLTELPFKPNVFHAGILRFSLPFVCKNSQPEALKQIYRALKPDAVLVVLNDGVLNETETDKSWNDLFAECSTFEGLSKMHYPSYDRLKVMAEEVGFKVSPATDLTDIAFGYLSPEICAHAFQSDKEQRKRLKFLFEKWRQKKVLPFEPETLRPNSLRVLWPMYTCVLQKKRGNAPSP